MRRAGGDGGAAVKRPDGDGGAAVRRPATRGRFAGATLLTLAVLGGPAAPGLGAQAPAPATARASLADFGLTGFADAAVRPHEDGTMVAVAVRIPVGSADDPDGRGGTAWLTARTLEAQAAATLDASDAVLTAEVQRSHTTYTLLATPDAWRQAWLETSVLLFDAPLRPDLFSAQRAALLARMTFERGSPARDFRQEAVAMLGEPGSPWVRPLQGSPATLDSITAAGAEAWRDGAYRRSTGTAAVVGPVPPGPERVDAPARDTVAQAWYVGTRVPLDREVTSTWLAVAYPAPAGTSRTALELVAHMIEEELDPVPPDPDRFGVEVRLEDAPRGTVLVIEASVLPEAADRWEARIQSAVARLSEDVIADDFFRWRRRHFRAHRLLEEARPEAEARRVADDLARSGRVRDLPTEIWSLDGRTLRDTAAALGEPRILRFGPDLRQQ